MADVLSPGVDLVEATGARLKLQVPELKKTGGAADLARLIGAKAMPNAHQVPAAFVIEPSDSAGPNALATGLAVRQAVTVQLVIVLAIYRPNDPTGADALEQLEILKPKVMTALIGWEPGGVCDALEHVRRGIVSNVGSPLVVWQHVLRTGWHLRKQ